MPSVGVPNDWTHLAPTRAFEIPAQMHFLFLYLLVTKKEEDNTKNEDIILAARWIGTLETLPSAVIGCPCVHSPVIGCPCVHSPGIGSPSAVTASSPSRPLLRARRGYQSRSVRAKLSGTSFKRVL